ncbi:MAG: AAA family ATPase [Planctomycetes bacterium]|nr:AAA family ATPase [Planctomycetota bacterium]
MSEGRYPRPRRAWLVAIVLLSAAVTLHAQQTGKTSAKKNGKPATEKLAKETPANPARCLGLAEDLLNHANTYYWLARARGDAPYEFEKAADFARQAVDKLNAIPKVKQNAAQIDKLLQEAKAHINGLKEREHTGSKALSNTVPLYHMLLKLDETFEFQEDPNEAVVRKAIRTLWETFGPKIIGVPQAYVVILSDPKSERTEEIVNEFLNENCNAYVISPHEIARYLSPEEIEQIYTDIAKPAPWLKLAKSYNALGITIIRIVKNDIVGDIYYFGAYYHRMDAMRFKKINKTAYSDGFLQDARRTKYIAWTLLFVIILLATASTPLFNILNKESTGHFAPFWVGGVACVLGIGVFWSALKALAAASPPPLEEYFHPAAYLWYFGAAATYTITPLAVCYLTFSRVAYTKDRLNNPEVISAIAFGSLAAAPALMGYYSILRFDLGSTLPHVIGWLLALWILSFFLGRSFSESAIKRETRCTVEYVILAVVIYLIGLLMLFWTHYSWLWPVIIAAIAAPAGRYGPRLIFCIIEKIKAAKESASDDLVDGLEWLAEQTSNPAEYILPQEGVLEEPAEFVIANTDALLQVIYIEAPQGCGKTRTAKEIADEIKRRYEEAGRQTIILFGDCDEFAGEGNAIPYEPFAQAMGDFLGVGRFDDPTQKAEKIKSGLTKMGLNVALSSVGLNAIGSLLDTQEEATADKKTTANEMAYVVTQGLINLSNSARVVFIIDDIHWMDPVTFEMFQKLFELLMQEFENNEISFILTAKSPEPGMQTGPAVPFVKQMAKEGKINFYAKVNQSALEHRGLIEGLLDSLRFDYDSRMRLGYFLRESGIGRPLHILQTVKTMIDNEMIEYVGAKFVIKREVDLAKLPQPDDFVRMVKTQLEGLDPRVVGILECAAIIGRDFRANILADIYDVDRLELLDMLRKAEKSNLIVDVRETHDLFRFTSKNTISVLRNMSNLSSRPDEKLSEMVKEYQYRYINVREKELKKAGIEITDAALSDITSLATRAFLIRDVMPAKALLLNKAAAEKSYERGRTLDAKNYYDNCVAIIREGYAIGDAEMLPILLSYSRCLLDAQGDKDVVRKNIEIARELIEKSASEYGEEQAELLLLECYARYQEKEFDRAVELAQQVLDHPSATRPQRIRAQYRIVSAMPIDSPERDEGARNAYKAFIKDIDKELAVTEDKAIADQMLTTKSNALDRLGLLLLRGFGDTEEALEHFDASIAINDETAINDRRGVALSRSGRAECYLACGRTEEAIKEYEQSLMLFELTGSTPNIVRVTASLAGIYRQEGRLNEADTYYNRSHSYAKTSNLIGGQLKAIAGIIETALDSGKGDDLANGVAKLEACLKNLSDEKKSKVPRAIETAAAALKRLRKSGKYDRLKVDSLMASLSPEDA